MGYDQYIFYPLKGFYRTFVFFFLIGWHTAAQGESDVVHVQLRWYHQFQFAGYYAAVEKGFYKEEGLNVRLVPGDPKHKPVDEVLSGRAEYAEGNSEVLYHRLHGKPLVALAAIFQHSPSVLIVRKDSGIKTLHDLIGKKVMLMNRTDDSEFLTMFLNEGINPSDINLLPSSFNLEDLISGKVDAFNSYLTNEPFFLQQRNIPYTIIDPVNYRIDFYSDILFTSEDELKEHPQRVEAMRRATLKGWKYAMDHPDEIIDLLINKYHVEKSREHLQFEAAEMRKLIFPNLIEIGHMNPERWHHMADTFVKAGLVEPEFTLEGFIYDPQPTRLPKWVTSAFISGVALITLMLTVLIYVLRLNRRLIDTKKTLLESENRFRLLFERNGDAMTLLDMDKGIFIDCNQAALDLFGFSEKNEMIGMKPHALSPLMQNEVETSVEKSKMMVELSRKHGTYHFEWLHKTPKRNVFPTEIVMTYFTMEGHTIGLATLRDITERKQLELRKQHRNRVLHMLNDKVPLEIVLDSIVRDLEMMNPDMLCSILLLDEDGKHLRKGAAPSLPDFYNNAIDGIEIGYGVGSCGTAAFTKELIVVDDIQNHPWWSALSDVAREAKLAACWSQPVIVGDGKVLGTFAIYHRYPTHPSQKDLQLIEDEAHLVGMAIDKSRADSRLKLVSQVFIHAREAIVITDAKANIIDVNETFTHMSGYSHDEVLGKNVEILKSPHYDDLFYETMWNTLLEKGYWHGEIDNCRKNGEIYSSLLTISCVNDYEGKAKNYIVLFSDISELKEYQRQLEQSAHYDALTHLPNRTLFSDRLHVAISQSRRNSRFVAVVYLDLDGFKAVNDTYGHAVGDQLLIAVSQRMVMALRDGDTLGRVGGDEFLAVLGNLEHPEDFEPIVERLLHSASDPIVVNDDVLHVSASIGVALYPSNGQDADQLVRQADQAMYDAKAQGKNRYSLFVQQQ